MTNFILKHRRVVVLMIYSFIGIVAYVSAYLLRFDFPIPGSYLSQIAIVLPIVIFCKLITAYYFGLNKGVWRYTSINDLTTIIKTVSASTLLFIAITLIVFTPLMDGAIPRSIYVLDWFLTIIGLCGIRLFVRLSKESFNAKANRKSGRKTLIFGAGDAGEMALRMIRQDFAGVYNVVGYLDDDPIKMGLTIHGVPVIGKIAEAGDLVQEYEISEVIFAIANTPKNFIRKLVKDCAAHNVQFKILPALKDLISGKLEVQKLRNVQVTDLLGRDSISIDSSRLLTDIGGKCIMVTGAGGSIGSELSRQISSCQPSKLLLLDVAETPLFLIDLELKKMYPDLDIEPVFCDIKDKERLEKVFAKYKPDMVYHAAAYKHVPMMEGHPSYAIRNNSLGTRNLAKASIKYNVKKFLMISTDKAVCPTNVMGASKRCAELFLSTQNNSDTHFITVRFGNVLGSNGSVIPVFRKQIEEGGPITVTHPDITRYFMTIPEAVKLVLHANAIGKGNELFMLEMGEPVKITELAKNMIELSGLVEGVDIEIKYSGLRPGEKMYEELSYSNEDVSPTDVPKLLVHRANGHIKTDFEEKFSRMEEAVDAQQEETAKDLLWDIVKSHEY